MIIEQIGLTLFGKMKGRAFSFSEGINVIEGENESGKSTIASFIRYIFFGVSEGTRGELYQKYLALNGGIADGFMILSCPQGRYRIERKCDAANGEETVSITDLANEAPIKGKDPAALFLGVDEETFLRTCMLSQLYGHTVSPKELGEAVENLLTGADESVNAGKAVEKLKTELEALEKRKLPTISAALAKAEKCYEEAVAEEEAYEKLTASYSENLKKAESDRKGLAECQRLVAHADAVHTIERVKRAMVAENRLKETEKSRLEAEKEAGFEGYLPDKSYIKDLGGLVSEIERCEGTLAECGAALKEKKEKRATLPAPVEGQEGQLLADIQSCIDRAASGKLYLIVSAVAALFCALLATVFFVVSQPILGVIMLICTLSAIAIGVAMYMKMRKAKEEENAFYASVGAGNRAELSRAVEQQARLLGRISLLETEIEEEEKEIAIAEEKRAELLSRGAFLAERWGKTAASREDLIALSEAAEEVCGHLEGLAAEEKQARLEYNTLKIDISEEELKRLFTLVKTDGVEKTPTTEEYKELTVKVNFYRQTSEALDKKTAGQKEQLLKMEVSMGDSFEAAARLEELKKEKTTTEERAELLRGAIAVLEESLARLRAELLPGVSKEASRFFAAASGSKYTALTAHDDFTVTVCDDAGRELPVTALSVGMAELAYMAVRFALSDRIFGEKKTPLILDESFAYLDDLRQAAAFMAIAERVNADKNQLFFFTCHKRETALFERLAKVYKITL